MSALDAHELLAPLLRSPAGTLWVARRPDGAVVELLTLEPLRDDIDEAFFRGDVVPAWERVTALGDARLPQLVDAPFRADGRNVLPFAHTPCISLDDVVARAIADGGLALPFVVAVGRELLGALARLHGAGIIHGDLHPRVLAATLDGRARILGAFLDRIPYYRDVLGMPPQLGYASPESMRGRALTPAADVYMLGVVLLELAAGRRAVDEPSLSGALAQSLAGPARAVDAARADLPDAFREIVRRMVLVEPTRRATLAQIAAVLDGELAWAAWTPEQVQAELRALFPERFP